ncbi:hypothetical protein [Fontibacillus sp. BL9]|uniref:hypothetical protein n=1 Tax=Fontibacillus sp. BL9 TaxID=3389971 RepID=UPI00397CB067
MKLKKYASIVLGVSVLLGMAPGEMAEAAPAVAAGQQKGQVSAIPTLSAVLVNGK